MHLHLRFFTGFSLEAESLRLKFLLTRERFLYEYNLFPKPGYSSIFNNNDNDNDDDNVDGGDGTAGEDFFFFLSVLPITRGTCKRGVL